MTTNTTPQTISRRSRVVAEIPTLLALAVPLIMGLTTSTMPGLVDTYMLGSLGETTLAAVSLTTSFLLIFYAGLYGFVGPVGLLIGQAYGAGEPARVAETLRHGLMLATLAGIAGALAMVALRFTLPYLGQPATVLEAITPYWLALSLSLIPFVLSMVFKQFYDAIDRPWIALGLTVVAVLANIGLNWLLIYGNLGFPRLGLTGAGIGSFLASCLGLGLMAAHYRFSQVSAPYRVPGVWSLAALRTQWHEGVPMAIQYILEGGAVAVAGIIIGWLGARQLAADQIVQSVTGILYMLPLGMAGAVSIRVSQAVGSNQRDRLPTITYTALGLVSIWALGFTGVLLLAGEDVAKLFVSDADLIATAGTIFVVFSLMQVFDGLQSVSLGALRGLLDNHWPTRVSLIGYWIIALPGALVGGPLLGGGAAGVWAGFALGLVIASVLLLRRLRWQFAQRE